jgi:hypothetical protein
LGQGSASQEVRFHPCCRSFTAYMLQLKGTRAAGSTPVGLTPAPLAQPHRNEGQLRGAGAYIHSVAVLANEPVSRERDGAITWCGRERRYIG